MYFRKQTWKDFGNFIRATRVEAELLHETNELLRHAKNVNPLMKWYKRKFWTVSPQGLLIESEIRQINIQIDQDWVHIQWYGTDWNVYDDLAFFDETSARDMAQLVAGTYIEKLKEDKKFYQEMLDKTEAAIQYAKLPPEWKKNAMLPDSETERQIKEPKELLSSNKKNSWQKKKKWSKKIEK